MTGGGSGSRSAGLFRGLDDILLLAVVVIVAGVVLGGCSVPGPPTSVSSDLLASVLKAIQVGLGLKFFAGATQVEHRHKGFFVVRRAEALARLHPEWTQDPTFQQLIQRVSQDFAEVQIVVNDLFKDGDPKSLRNPAPDGTSNTTTDQEFTCDADKHIDLDNVSKVSIRPAARGQAYDDRTKEYLETYLALRESAARAIVWRAAAIHAGTNAAQDNGLWNNSATSSRLRKTALLELLDRRLRTVERMETQVNAPQILARFPRGTVGHGPWVDGTRVRMFEYPFFNVHQATDLIPPNDARWQVTNLAGTSDQTITWSWHTPTGGSREIPTRIYPEPDFVPPGDGPHEVLNTSWLTPLTGYAYDRTYVAPSTDFPDLPELTDVMTTMMQPKFDIWRRAWLYCDHVCLTLQVDALRFALLRRQGQADPVGTFKKIGHGDPAQGQPDRKNFVVLGAALGKSPTNASQPASTWVPPNDHTLFSDGPTATWFDNAFAPAADLQVGDHVIFWNHILYVALYPGAFRLENAVVVAIDSDHVHGSIDPRALRLSGHGLSSSPLAGYGQKMADELNKGLDAARLQAIAFDAAGAGIKGFKNRRGFTFFKWDPPPYPGLQFDTEHSGAWFLYLPRKFPDDNEDPPYQSRWPTIAAMLSAINHSIVKDAQTPADPDYKDPPTSVQAITPDGGTTTVTLTDGVFLPLFLPKIGTQVLEWPAYFTQRKGHPAVTAKLTDLILSGAAAKPEAVTRVSGDIPGFFIAGNEALPIQLLRPKVRL